MRSDMRQSLTVTSLSLLLRPILMAGLYPKIRAVATEQGADLAGSALLDPGLLYPFTYSRVL